MVVGFCWEIVGFVLPAARIVSGDTGGVFPWFVVIHIPYGVSLGLAAGDGDGGGDIRQAHVGG